MKKKFFSMILIVLVMFSTSVSVFAVGETEPHVMKPNIAIQQVLPVDK